MNKILRALLYLTLVIFIIFAAIQPYNWFCKISGKCSEINFSNLRYTHEGEKQITALMEVMNNRNDVEFEAIEPKMFLTVSGRKNVTTYHIKNISDDSITFRPEFKIEPKEMAKYIDREECLCFREYKLKRGEEVIVPASFRFKSKIDRDFANTENVVVRLIYSAKAK